MKRGVIAFALATISSAALAQSFQRTDGGIVVTPTAGPEKTVRLQVYGDELIRVTSTPTGDLNLPSSLMVIAKPVRGGFSVNEGPGHVTLKTSKVSADVDLTTGNVSFRDAAGRTVLAETAPPTFATAMAEGKPFLSVTQQFNRNTDEGFYGLGQHQFGQMNYNGEDVDLAQHNMDVAIPFVVSSRNYGLLWDNNSITRFGNPKPYPPAGGPGDGLQVTGANGASGWTATYTANGKVIAARQEPVIDLQYLENRKDWPAGTRTADGGDNVPGLKVTWAGKVTPTTAGLHRFRLYSSGYAKVFVDGREVLDRWRQNWNPFYHNFDVQLDARPHDIRIEWEPQGGYIGLLHSDPIPEADRHSLTLSSEFGHGLDYYFVGGRNLDEVIAGYRHLTGKAPIMPKWAYGFWQSRQRYETQDQLLGVLREYRKRGLPLDNIVQDWNYWPQDQWGCQCFDTTRFPDAKAMVDEVHKSGAHVMISVWAKLYPNTANYKELDSVGGILRNMVTPRADEPMNDPNYVHAMYRDWIAAGYPNAFYDPYNQRAKDIYARQVIQGIGTKGFDAWWLDSDEPDFHSNLSIPERTRRMSPTAAGPAAAFFNSYPLEHVEGVYDHLVAFKPDVRPFILTRSGFGGIQRAGAAIWSGDVASRWDNFREQIAAGINFSLSGLPNWSHDIGGYTMEPRFLKPTAADLDEWRELNTRWLQFGAFSPIFRSHGENIHREIFEMSPEGSPTYKSMVWYDQLRYRLMPYIYSNGADTYFEDGTVMRGLVMDFESDRKVWDVGDEYMFGPAILVAPVTEYKARSRKVYLPAGRRWYDFYSGHSFAGGQTINADAPYERMPLFVRAGSIIPTGPAIQFTGNNSHAPLTLNVYTGANGSFSVYEDDGVSRQYLHGKYARIPVTWNEASKTLTIGAREGSYAGMAGSREIRIRWMRPSSPHALAFDAKPDATITYDGRQQTVRMR
jgi:alpha-D-xyloside xylohydrolase